VGNSNTLLLVICLAGMVTYLWLYFGFVGFGLNKFKAGSRSKPSLEYPSCISAAGAWFFVGGSPGRS
jgi:hypothetical protein